MRPSAITLAVTMGLICVSGAPSAAQTTQPAQTAIDACGVLVRGSKCVLFEGAGGKYYIPDTGRFQVGDAVRVVGTLDRNCVTICQEGDGCIRGAVLYDPNVLPCGTALPNFPGDLISGLCTTAAGALTTFTVIGLYLTRRRA